MTRGLAEFADNDGIASAIASANEGIASFARNAASITTLASSFKPFTFDNDEVNHLPAAQQWPVCTP